jgi:hypothetical protein
VREAVRESGFWVLSSGRTKHRVLLKHTLTQTLICCSFLRSKKGTYGCQANTKKMPLIFLEPGFGTNGLYIGMGF